ncbi:MAG: hypothetical protein MI921_02900 [Cytophagales bacterium]|nr:hypothetical protein [Cytophagales bacterium]
MNDLVKRLSDGKRQVQANRPETKAITLKERIEIGYLHILFKETGTELGIKLDSKNCDFTGCDFEKGSGTAHFEGGVKLNYENVKCVADIDLNSLEGEGYLEPIEEEQYNEIVGNG